MTNAPPPRWEPKRTPETQRVEEALREAGFEQVDAYRYNSASIRVRVVDPRFEGVSAEQRDTMISRFLELLPDHTQADIMNLFAFAPSELQEAPKSFRTYLMNTEFDDPCPSML